MKTVSYKYLLPVIIILIWASCKKPYNPIAVGANLNYLVVEGSINTGGTDTTFIKLNRTSNIASAITGKVELKATIKVEGDNNTAYALTEKGLGVYYLAPVNLGFVQKYRLRIKTNDGKEYLSDFTESKQAPPIDAINFNATKTGVTISVNSHDATNKTRYYRWDFVETWEYYSKYQSLYISNGKQVVLRDMVNNQIYHCWKTANSTSILLGSTAKLSQDIVTDQPITSIDQFSPKITVKYSILLKQYGISTAEYNYWENIKKNNESLGSIFDSQPSDSPGNIHCLTKPEEVVIGYVGAGAYSSKRIFIDRTQIPIFTFPLDNCVLDTVYFVNSTTMAREEDIYFNTPNPPLIPIENFYGIGHTGSSPDCVDCRVKGGVTKKPSFWP